MFRLIDNIRDKIQDKKDKKEDEEFERKINEIVKRKLGVNLKDEDNHD